MISRSRTLLRAVAAGGALCIPSAIVAQELSSDRPDFTESITVVTRPQLEAGYTWSRAAATNEHSIGEMLLRLGLTSRLELRLGISSLVVQSAAAIRTTSFGDASVGAKVSLGPSVSMIVGTTIPAGSKPAGGSDVAPEILFAAERALTERTMLGANAGATFGSSTELSGSLVAGHEIGAVSGVFLETFGMTTPENGVRRVYVDAGMTRRLTPDLQVDARMGRRVSGTSDWFFGVGVVRRW